MKTRQYIKSLFLLAAVPFLFTACLKDKVDTTVQVNEYGAADYAIISQSLDLPNPPHLYVQPSEQDNHNGHFFPDHFMRQVTNSGATLGRVLFYDTRLSANNEISCASCHHQEKGFADDVALSKGFDGVETRRNSLAIGVNVSNYGNSRVFWDERANSIEEQTRMTIEDEIEMGLDMDVLVERLENIDYYKVLFKEAFGTEKVTSDNISDALAQFVRAMFSENTEFNQALEANHFDAHRNFSEFTPQENSGKALFMEHCSGCHGQGSTVFRNTAVNGLDLEYTDNGVGEVTGHFQDNGRFKVPLLRNIALSSPYMHDGRFETLHDVVEHYNSGIQAHDNLDFELKDGSDNPKRLNLTEDDKDNLVAFLHTFTDNEFITDTKFATPFK